MKLIHVDQGFLKEITDVNLTREIGSTREYRGTADLTFELKPDALYPFDTYNITVILYDDTSFNRSKVEEPVIEFDLRDQLKPFWNMNDITSKITTDGTLLSDDRELVYFSTIINRQSPASFWLLFPVYLSLTVLCLTVFLGTNRKDWLSNRITVYVSLFVFVFTYESVILSSAPLRTGISPIELLIYLIAVDTVLLLLTSVLTDYFAGRAIFLKQKQGGTYSRVSSISGMATLCLVSFADLLIFFLSFGIELFQTSLLASVFAPLLLIPVLIGSVTLYLQRKQSRDAEYLFDYVTTAASEGLVSNTKKGINYLAGIMKKKIPNYKDEIKSIDSIMSFLSDLLIANANRTYVRETILAVYKDLFLTGVEKKSDITYTITSHLRLLSEQLVRKENALASRGLLFASHDLLDRIVDKKHNAPVLVDASVTYTVVSSNVLKEKLFSLISLNTELMGTLIYKTSKKEKLESVTLRLLSLLDEYVTQCTDFGDARLTWAVHYYAKLNLDMTRSEVEGRDALLKKIEEIGKKVQGQ